MIDTHSHINFEEYRENFEGFLSSLRENDIENVIIPGVEPSSFDDIVNLCDKYDMLFGAIGVHPSEVKTFKSDTIEQIKKYLKNKKIVAVGEIGLDYYWSVDDKEEQKKIFQAQLELAQDVQLPVIIHDRLAHDDCFNILQDFNLKDVIFHCFSGNSKFALKCVDKGYYIAIGGVVTFKNANDLKQSAKAVPLDKILLETDAPYLTPVPFRGKLNNPVYLKYIAQEIANIKGIDVETVKNQTVINSKKVFQI